MSFALSGSLSSLSCRVGEAYSAKLSKLGLDDRDERDISHGVTSGDPKKSHEAILGLYI